MIICGVLYSCTKDEVETMGTIYGIVNDADTGEPIVDAHVSLTPYGKTINTGGDGGYEFQELEPGQYTIQISKSGYKTNTKRISVVPGEKASGDMMLKRGVPSISLSVSSLNFGGRATNKTFSIRNISTSGTSVSWQVSQAFPVSWLSVTPSNGSTAASKESVVSVNVNRDRVTKDETATLIVEADGESFPVEILVSKNGEGDDGENDTPAGGSCGEIIPFDMKLETEFLSCTKMSNMVEFQFRITNMGEDIEVFFETDECLGYDNEGNKYARNDWYVANEKVTGPYPPRAFPKNVPIKIRVLIKNIPSTVTSITRYEFVVSNSAPVLNKKMILTDLRW